MRQEDHKFKASLDYIARLFLRKTKTETKIKQILSMERNFALLPYLM
jgi:hypothetical protein